jgi:hypothetical protein
VKYELVEGDTDIINRMVKDGWGIENTFPNPHPQPYFFALMRLNSPSLEEAGYDLRRVIEEVRKIQHARPRNDEIPF